MNYHLDTVWPEPTDEVREEVVEFWLTESAIPDRPIAEQRAQQLVVVARDSVDQVAGVSTAVRAFVPQLGFECFYYRTFVGRSHRARGLRSTDLVKDILRESYRVLDELFCQGYDPQVLGIYAEIENPSIMRHRNEAIWQDNGANFVYIGNTQDGKPMRVWYFHGARLP
jgi:hypothetical protein